MTAGREPGFGLYVHWPFCRSKCPYCDFNSHVRAAVDHGRWRRALLREMEHYGASTKGRRLTSIFFGGGTPSLMEPETVGAVIEQARRIWHADAEYRDHPGSQSDLGGSGEVRRLPRCRRQSRLARRAVPARGRSEIPRPPAQRRRGAAGDRVGPPLFRPLHLRSDLCPAGADRCRLARGVAGSAGARRQSSLGLSTDNRAGDGLRLGGAPRRFHRAG